MKTISRLVDLEPYGIIPLTGESCGLMMRLLCDVTEPGRKVLAKCFGITDFKLAEPWNGGRPGGDKHIGSIMLDHDAYLSVGVFALLENGCEEVYKLYPLRGRGDQDCHKMLSQALRSCLARISLIGTAGEPMNPDGTPAWGAEIKEAEAALKAASPQCLFSEEVLYGMMRLQDSGRREEWLDLARQDGWTWRRYAYQGTAGDRNRHVMSGRVE